MNDFSIEHNRKLYIFSMYDEGDVATEPYFPTNKFKGFASKKVWFIIKAWQQGIKSGVVALSHINLLVPGYLIKICSPKTKLVLIAHGIEVWRPLSFLKKRMLQKIDLILPVSHFTQEKMKALFHLPKEKFLVLNNCLDPYLPPLANEAARSEWRKKLGIEEGEILLMTLSRLSAKEKNKNYDKVLSAIKQLKQEWPHLKYLFVGKYEEEEKQRLDILIQSLGLKDAVIFTGFVPDNELAFYYNMADIYIMPSEKEGFGISFIEAMYYGKPVIAGNRDGTTDALMNGQLGTLIDPRSGDEIIAAIKKIICNKSSFAVNTDLLLENFGYATYKKKWEEVLANS